MTVIIKIKECMINPIKAIIDSLTSFTKPILKAVDESNLTDDEKFTIASKLREKKIEIAGEIQNKAFTAHILDSKSTSKFRSYARPALLWLFYIMILLSIPMGVINYFFNDFYLAVLDGMRTYLSIIPEYMVNGFMAVIGVGFLGRTFEKIKGLK